MACVTSGWVSIGRAVRAGGPWRAVAAPRPRGECAPGGRGLAGARRESCPRDRRDARDPGPSAAQGASHSVSPADAVPLPAPPTAAQFSRRALAAPGPRPFHAGLQLRAVGVAHGGCTATLTGPVGPLGCSPSARAVSPRGSKAFLPAARFCFSS